MSTLEIHCSKPECHWHGPPADAADHLCPTPAEADLVADIPQDDTGTSAASGLPIFATRQGLEAWLGDHGVYTATGEPADAATAEADRQYAIFLAADRDPQPEPEPSLDPEPDVEPDVEPQPTVEEQEDAAAEAGGDVIAFPDQKPWQVDVADQIRARDDARQIRWALIDEDEHELVEAHPIKAAATTALVEQLHAGREVTMHRISDVLSAADKLASGSEHEPDLEPAGEPITPAAREAVEQLLDNPPVAETPDEGALAGDLDDEDAEIQAIDARDDDPDPALIETRPGATNTPPLFDAADYDREDLAVPKIDGNAIDRIALNFAGAVMLDRSAPLDVALYNRVHAESTVELWVEAKWGGTAATPATNRDGDLDVIIGRKTLRIETIRVLDPAVLGQIEGLELVREAVRRAARAGVPDDQIEAAAVATLAE